MKYIFGLLDKHRKVSLFMAIIWTIIIFIGCSLPGRDLPSVDLFDQFDKVVHFTFFIIFFVFWYFSPTTFYKKSFIWILIAGLTGFAIEFYQLNFVAGRSFDIWDGIADTFGALAGYFCIHFIYNKY